MAASASTESKMKTPSMQNKMNFLLVGQSGAGKSESCCTILGELTFDDDWSGKPSVKSSVARKSLLGYEVTIIDTPGIYGSVDTSEITEEVRRSFSLVPCGFTAIVYVIRLGRISEETDKSIRLLRELFGDLSNAFTTIIFTHKDQLQKGRHKITVEEFIGSLPETEVCRLLKDCDNRFVAFDNMQEPNSSGCLQQVEEFMNMMKKLADENRRYYTPAMMEEAKQKMREREEGRKKEADRKKEERYQRIKQEVENEMGLTVDLPSDATNVIADNRFAKRVWRIWRKYRKSCFWAGVIIAISCWVGYKMWMKRSYNYGKDMNV